MNPTRAIDWRRTERRALRLRSNRGSGRYEGNAHLFVEDVRIWAMPIRIGREAPAFRAELSPAAPGWEEVLVEALGHNGRRDSLSEVCCDFFQKLAVQLALDGRALYEIVRGPMPSEQGARPFVLSFFSDEGVRRVGQQYIQEGPTLSLESAEHVTAHIPAGNVWEVRLPRTIGVWHEQSRLVELLSRLSPYPPEWVHQEWAANTNRTGYDFVHHRVENEILLARATKGWGWNPRMLWKESVFDYYEVYRTLKFRTALAQLREHMVAEMNVLLQREGCRSVLQFLGIPTSEELAAIARDLQDGRKSYATVLKQSAITPSVN